MTERKGENRSKVLVVDDDRAIHRVVQRILGTEHDVRCFEHPRDLLEALEGEGADADLLLTDLQMPDLNGIEVLQRVKEMVPNLPVIFMTGQATVESAVEAMKLGAYDYLLKPMSPPDVLLVSVRRALDYRRLVHRNRVLESKLTLAERFETMVGESKAMHEMFSLIESVSGVDVTVLIQGESGTGKELVARAIHDKSSRAGKRFIAINCGALTESVLESELFGHVKGAFTGAIEGRRGLFEEASGSTLLLDEIGEMPQSTQVKLLRILQEGELRPVGSNETRQVDVRVLAATHQNLAEAVQQGRFREDLYFRLNVVPIEVPPLRDRPHDIPALVHHFVAKNATRMNRPVNRIDEEALELLAAHDWPGNVRELENAIARAVVLAKGDSITVDLLPAPLRRDGRQGGTSSDDPLLELPFSDAREAFEKRYLCRLLSSTKGNVAEAARAAEMDSSNLHRVLKRLEIDAQTYRQ